jgi:D-alanyl-D-alanine-carboxypeptidase/D-alanyl-D-alanine-endopeptidase
MAPPQVARVGLGILAQHSFDKMKAILTVIQYFRSMLLLPAAQGASMAVRRSAARVILSGLLLVALAALGYAQQPLSLADADLRGAVLFQQSGATGMVLVVVRNNEVMIKGYGETYPGSGVRPASNSLIRLCSISKVFTGELLQELANEGKIRLDDPLQRYAPPHRMVPQGAGGIPITLQELATHTSGLSREVSSYPPKAPHFTFPDRAFRWAWLPRQKLIFRPGTAALYSNVGFDFLGDALATATHESYAHLLNESLLRPLGMWDTTLVPSQEQCARLLHGTGEEGPCTDTQASGPSGGVYSTSTDMARMLQHLLHISGSGVPPAPAMGVYLKPAQLKSMEGLSHAGDPTGIGLGWIQLGDPNSPSVLMEKTGGGAGFGTYIALSPQRQTGVFLAITEGKGREQIDFFHEGNYLLAALENVPPLPPRTHPVRAAKRKPSRLHRPHRKTAR